jgi:GTP-binding protein EngB required for normal cell division
VVSNFRHTDKLLSEIEGILSAASSKAAFPKFIPDITPAQSRTVEAYLARVRTHMLRVLDSVGVPPGRPDIGMIRAIRVHLTFVRIAIEECTPDHLRGYGEVPDGLVPELEGLSAELEGVVSALDSVLAQGPGCDLKDQLARLSNTSTETDSLKRIEEIVTRWGLVEFRAPLKAILERLASPRFEIALFGQVSCGKSSLLNHIIGQELLPIGVNPVTTVPTRVVYAAAPEITVWFVDRQVKKFVPADLPEFVTEERNPGNAKGVVRIVAGVPAYRLRDGVVFVDTPGLGSLAASGAAETKAYLPQCDLGVVLINSSATLGPEDVATIQALYQAGVQPAVVLSKADLLTPQDRLKALDYIERKLRQDLGTNLQVSPVSVVRGDQALLDQWFKQQIVPLYGWQQTLALDSIRRKIGVLREAMARALEIKLRPRADLPSNRLKALETADQQLRAAAGRLASVEKDAIHASQSIRDLAPDAMTWAARRLVDAWRGGGETSSREILREAVAEVARNATGEIVAEMVKLAVELSTAVTETARALDVSMPSVDGEFRDGIRDLPQIDLTQIKFDPTPPFLACFGERAAICRTKRQLRKNIEDAASVAFTSHSRALQTWIRTVLSQLKSKFDLSSDGYRAQLARMLNPLPESTEDLGGVESDIAWLRRE